MAYDSKVVDHFENPRNVGTLDTECVKTKTIEDAKKITNQQIVAELSLPPVKVHCSVLAEDAIRAAISDWQQKRIK